MLKFGTGRVRVRNTAHDSLPVVVHGNRNTKVSKVTSAVAAQTCGTLDIFLNESFSFLMFFNASLTNLHYIQRFNLRV